MSRNKHKQTAHRRLPERDDAGRAKTATMNPAAATSTAATAISDDGAPFGTRPRLVRGPLIAWCVVYAIWLGVLVYMAAYTVGWK